MPRKKVKMSEVQENKDGLVDFYKEVPKALLKTYRNPNFEKHKISVPFYGIICGGTGAGKTQTLLNIIKKMNGTFEKMVLCVKNADEPLYQFLKMRIPQSQLEIFEGGVIPDVDQYKHLDEQILVVFDDLVGMKNQQPIIEFFIRGRKIAGGCSMVYLTQSWFKVPKIIRIQCNHIFIKRLTSNRDLNLIISEYGYTNMKEDIIRIYKEITQKDKVPFLLIRTDGDPHERFSKNFLQFLEVEDKI